MGKLYLQVGGGAGDFIYKYFMSHEWQTLPVVKRFFSDCLITVVVATHNVSTAELIYTNPNIDSVLTYPWYPPGHPKERSWKEMVCGESYTEWIKANKIRKASEHRLEHKVYLTESESLILNKIRQSPYVVIHPFAGLPHRGCLRHPFDNQYKCYPDYKYIQSANLLIEKGYTPVFVGRTSYDGLDSLRNFSEDLPDTNELYPQAINLINKCSFRLNVELTRNANGFIGSHSSMLSAAWTADTPSVYFYPSRDEHGNLRSVREHGGTTGTWAMDKPIHYGYELSPSEFLELNPEAPVNKLMEHVR